MESKSELWMEQQIINDCEQAAYKNSCKYPKSKKLQRLHPLQTSILMLLATLQSLSDQERMPQLILKCVSRDHWNSKMRLIRIYENVLPWQLLRRMVMNQSWIQHILETKMKLRYLFNAEVCFRLDLVGRSHGTAFHTCTQEHWKCPSYIERLFILNEDIYQDGHVALMSFITLVRLTSSYRGPACKFLQFGWIKFKTNLSFSQISRSKLCFKILSTNATQFARK